MAEGGIGQPDVLLAVQADPVELGHHVIRAVPGHVVEKAGGLVDLDDIDDFEGMVGQLDDQLAADVIEEEIAVTGPFGRPDEALVVLEPLGGRGILDPAGRPFLVDEDAAFAGGRIGGGEFQDVLAAVGPVEVQLLAVGRPGHVVDVVADDGVVEGFAVPRFDLDRGLGGDVIDEEIGDRVGLAGLRIGLDVGLGIELGLVHLQDVIGDLALVEPVVGQLLAVRRPPHGVALGQLLAVDPAGRTVLDAVLDAAFSGDGDLVLAVGVAQPDVAVAIEGLELLVGGDGLGELPAALGPSHTTAAQAFGRGGRSTAFDGLFGGQVVLPGLAVPVIGERLAVVGPFHLQGAGFHRALILLAHLLELLVAGVCLQAVLGRGQAGRERQKDDQDQKTAFSHRLSLKKWVTSRKI